MKTLFVAYRVTDIDRSLDFYTALGYVELGRVDGGESSPGQTHGAGLKDDERGQQLIAIATSIS
jgi:catechol 2,3-dioxygenase-like lactoylglutathione lyase family enzyme